MMKNYPVIEDGVLAGNLFPKYSTRNPIARTLVNGFLGRMDGLVSSLNPPDIHEAGCGEGYLISRYAGQDRKLTGSDFSKQVIAFADETARSQRLNVQFKVRSIYALKPEEDSAALVICSQVMEHLKDPALALDALAGIARPYLIASVPREPLWRVLNIARGYYLRDLGNTPWHIQHWSKSGFLKFLGRRFEILQVLSPLPFTLVLARVRS